MSCMSNNVSGLENVCVGNYAGTGITTGYQNVMIGHAAGSTTVGDNNICIGDLAKNSANNVSNEIVIGGSATGKGSYSFYTNVSSCYNGGNTANWNVVSD